MTTREATADTRAFLLGLFEAAVAAAHPDVCLPGHLPAVPERGRLVIVGAGKAAAAMAQAVERHYRAEGALDRIGGFTTAPHGTVEALPG
jgi:hydroxypyruvate reductase